MSKRNKTDYRNLKASIIRAIINAHLAYDASNPAHHCYYQSPAPFWWLIFNLELILFAPTAQSDRGGLSIQ